jgi:arylsulfatase A-like enzyme
MPRIYPASERRQETGADFFATIEHRVSLNSMWVRVFLVGMTAASCQRSVAVERPAPTRVENLILVTIDTLRADVLGYNGGRARTPVLDSLAERSWRFDQCYSASMLTNPSHASILTSLYPRDHGVYDNESGLADGAPTVARAAAQAGLKTAAVINFPHLNPEVANLGGFDRVVPATREERRAPEIARAGLEIIDSLAGSRFFVWLHFTDPHAPYEPPASHEVRPPAGKKRTPLAVAARAAPRFQRNNPWFQQALRRFDSVEEVIQQYLAEVEVADTGLGVLIAGLALRGLHERTALVVTSDHGENLGEHNLYFHHGGLYRETVHVPLLVALPGAAPARVSDQVETVDIAPTITDLLGVPAWQPMRGRSLGPLAREGQGGREYVFSEHMLAQQVAVRGHQGTLILHRRSTRQFPTYAIVAGQREIYDRRQDPHEQADQGEGGPLAHLLGTALDEYMARGLQLAARPAVDQDRESLRVLGYIE